MQFESNAVSTWTEWQSRGKAEGHAIVCSQMFSDAHLDITLQWLRGCKTDALVTPAALSATTDLVDIGIPWLKVPT
jgi:hypothetical protein